MATLTVRFDNALLFSSILARALDHHGGGLSQTGRALGLASLVLVAQGNEDEAIAALLLDVAGSEKGAGILTETERLFGNSVTRILSECLRSDYRNLQTIQTGTTGFTTKLAGQLNRSLLVAMADSIFMAMTLHAQLTAEGPRAWNRFNVAKEKVLARYEQLASAFITLRPGAMSEQFAALVWELTCFASPYADTRPRAQRPPPFRPNIFVVDD